MPILSRRDFECGEDDVIVRKNASLYTIYIYIDGSRQKAGLETRMIMMSSLIIIVIVYSGVWTVAVQQDFL
jgi:hypothetical protein